MSAAGRILHQADLQAMVALDNIDTIAQRIRNLMSHGRRVTLVDRFLHDDSPPRVTPGLTVDRFDSWANTDSKGFEVWLKPGPLVRFSISAHAGENDTEREERKRFKAGKSTSDRWSERRRDMTEVTINGGVPGSGPALTDLLVIRSWNGDGVCDERVVAFDNASDIRREVNALTWELDEIRGFLCKYPTLPPGLRAQALNLKPGDTDPEMAVVERLREILRRHHPVMVMCRG